MSPPIVVGTDGSESSRRAVARAAVLAQVHHSTVIVVFVRPTKHTGNASVFAIGALAYLRDAIGASQTLAEAQGITELDSRGVDWKFIVREGQPAAQIMTVAQEYEADTIVVSGGCHSAIGGIAYGSVTVDLLHRWPLSLFVVRSPDTKVS
jgi:nucleotide-binding universal stress UspA family protein